MYAFYSGRLADCPNTYLIQTIVEVILLSDDSLSNEISGMLHHQVTEDLYFPILSLLILEFVRHDSIKVNYGKGQLFVYTSNNNYDTTFQALMFY